MLLFDLDNDISLVTYHSLFMFDVFMSHVDNNKLFLGIEVIDIVYDVIVFGTIVLSPNVKLYRLLDSHSQIELIGDFFGGLFF